MGCSALKLVVLFSFTSWIVAGASLEDHNLQLKLKYRLNRSDGSLLRINAGSDRGGASVRHAPTAAVLAPPPLLHTAGAAAVTDTHKQQQHHHQRRHLLEKDGGNNDQQGDGGGAMAWLAALLQPFIAAAARASANSGDGGGGEGAAPPLLYWPPRPRPSPPQPQQQQPKRPPTAAAALDPRRWGGGGNGRTRDDPPPPPPPVIRPLAVTVSFTSAGSYGSLLRLPAPPRALEVTALRASDGAAVDYAGGVPYVDGQVATLSLPAGERYTIELRDDDNEALTLWTSDPGAVDATDPNGGALALSAQVRMQLLMLQARFNRLAWAGGLQTNSGDATETNVAVIGAKVTVWTHGAGSGSGTSESSGGPVVWSSRYTDRDGLALFFVPPDSNELWANFTLGPALLASRRLGPAAWQGGLPGEAALAPPVQPVDADRSLLCTGDLEEVRAPRGASGGSFPPPNAAGAYAPPAFTCRWAIVPPAAGARVALSIDYSTLAPGEAVVVHLSATSAVVLTPNCCGPAGVYVATVTVDGSLPIDFRTSARAGARLGGFRVHWRADATEGGGGGARPFEAREILIVVVSVAAAALGALGFCAYCARWRRQRREAAAAAAAAVALAAGGRRGGPAPPRSCPTPVRALLPRKPYVPPGHNPLPGAPGNIALEGGAGAGGCSGSCDGDACSICLCEFDAGEVVTVLPCRHFYHGPCIEGWLKRGVTCPLCKADVLAAVEALAASRPCSPPIFVLPPRGGGAARLLGAAGGGEDDEATVSVSVFVAPPRSAGASPRPPAAADIAASAPPADALFVPVTATAAAVVPAAAGGGGASSRRASRASSSGAAALRSPRLEPAGRADATADDFLAAARAAAALAAILPPPPPPPQPSAGAPPHEGRASSGGGGSVEMSLSRRLLGALRGAPGAAAAAAADTNTDAAVPLPGSVAAALDAAEAGGEQPAAAAAAAAAPAIAQRVVSVYAYAGPFSDGGGNGNDSGNGNSTHPTQ